MQPKPKPPPPLTKVKTANETVDGDSLGFLLPSAVAGYGAFEAECVFGKCSLSAFVLVAAEFVSAGTVVELFVISAVDFHFFIVVSTSVTSSSSSSSSSSGGGGVCSAVTHSETGIVAFAAAAAAAAASGNFEYECACIAVQKCPNDSAQLPKLRSRRS